MRLALFFASIVFIPISHSAEYKTVYVDPYYNEQTPGWGTIYFNTIQTAIDYIEAKPDDDWTVHVYPGTYYENIKINRTLRLRGEDKNTTIIDGNKGGYVIDISALENGGADGVCTDNDKIGAPLLYLFGRPNHHFCGLVPFFLMLKCLDVRKIHRVHDAFSGMQPTKFFSYRFVYDPVVFD